MWLGCGRLGDKAEFYADKDPSLLFSQSDETFKQSVDIVWVVDNSGSMGNEQAALAENFGSFISDFLELGIDFQKAIVTTDDATNRDAAGRLNASYARENRADFIRLFKETIKVGIGGSGTERGLLFGAKFLEDNPGWSRNTAHLVVIYISDENDFSGGGVSGYIDRMEALKDEGRVTAFAITNSQGGRYRQAANATGGRTGSITGSFSDILDEFGKAIIELAREFKLPENQPLDVSKIDEVEILVDGNPVPRDAWEYLEAANSIRFKEGHVPGSGSKIRITYTDMR